VNDQWKMCSAKGCVRRARTRGSVYCDMHYRRVGKTGTPGPGGLLRRVPLGVCTVEDCAKTCRSSGSLYCEMHYCRLRRTGTLTSTRLFPYPEACLAEGCSKKPNSHGYCSMHATRIERHGNPHIVIAPSERRVRRGPDSPGWLSDDVVDYRTVHMRLRRIIGSARTMQCVDCGKRKAVHWSYDHQDPDERMTPEGVPFSIKPSHYQPRCASCHKFFDHAYLRREAVRKALADLVTNAEQSGNAVAAEFARSYLATEWPRFVGPSCDGRWLDCVPERGAA
jgi:hypothetical protein